MSFLFPLFFVVVVFGEDIECNLAFNDSSHTFRSLICGLSIK